MTAEPRGQRTIPESKPPVVCPPGGDCVDRVTAFTIAARIHRGRGTTPDRVIADAEAYAEWVRTGAAPVPPVPCICAVFDPPHPGRPCPDASLEVPRRFSDSDVAQMQQRLPSMHIQQKPPNPGRLGEQGQWGTVNDPTPRRRWWRR